MKHKSFKIVQGQITEEETGETTSRDHYLFCSDFKMSSIVKILKVSSFVHPDDSLQISVDCQAIDTVGGVFELGLEFAPSSIEQRDEIIKDLKVDSLFEVIGGYLTAEKSIWLSDPQYQAINPELEDELREVFRINSVEWVAENLH